jgi:hypothetical protein
MAKKAEIVSISRFRRGNPLDGVPEIELGLVSEDNRAVRPTSAPAVDLSGLPKTWFLIGNGGAGKTTYARWLIDRMVEQGRQAALAALDPGTRALSSWYDEIVQPASRDSGRTEKWLADFLEYLMESRTPAIMDFGAAGDVSLRAVVESTGGLHGNLEAAGLGVVAAYLMSPRIWDIDPLAKLEAVGFQPKATLIVLNEGTVDSTSDPQEAFEGILRHSAYRKAVDRGAVTLWLPALDPEVMNEIELKRLLLTAARDGRAPDGASFSPIGGLRRSKVGRWMGLTEQAHTPIHSWLP